MDFRILGPLEVHDGDGPIDVRGRKPRAVLAVLLLHPNQPVSAERLAVALWGREAPAGAVRTVHVNVSRLRKALRNGDILTTTPAGYQLRVLPGELDAVRFESLVDEGRRAMARGQADEAGRLLREALALWRGPPLADLEFEPFAHVEIARLEEQHEAAIVARVDADLAAGRHEELVAELRRLVAEHPTRERLAGQLMLALYRCGRQADALDAYREARRRLADELGVEPGDELRALQDAVLHQDPKLLLEPAGELPHELDATSAPPLVGRETEMAWLRERWDEACAGHGRLTALAGTRGIGRTRLAAELAGEVHASGGGVLYASGTWPARAVGDVLERARSARRPLLLVVDDADQASRDVLTAVRDVAGGEALVLATATAHEALEGLEPGMVLFLDLDRLGPAAVAKIAALYVPDETADVLPAEWLLGASAGVPQRVHDVASQWARERVDTVAGNAAAERSRLRSMEDELAGGVAQLQAVREWRAPPEDGEQRVICPFKGLASFEADDAPYFFGRERLVAELVARLVGAPLLAVVGPSGSGKSSVVRAGLLPALKSGVLPGSEHWPQTVIRPGEQPVRQLDAALANAPADRFVLAVDQFEETFTVCRDEAERATFISQLVRESPGVVVIALRADFYGRCAEYPVLSRLLATNHVLVGPMQPEELRRAVVCPAQRVGLSVEDELVERIVADVEDAPGALPLLSTALLELWQSRDRRRLRLAAYERTGGVHGAVARLAEEAYNHLDDEQRELARSVLLQLVEVDDDGTVERRRLPLSDLGAKAEPLLDLLADARLVTVSEGTVELAHEALLREWPRLSGWIEESLDDLRIERTLRTAAYEWQRVAQDEGALYRGARLAEASDWAARVGHTLSGDAREFLDASCARERRDRAMRRRRLTVAFGGLAVGLVVIAVVAALAINQRNAAEHERDLTTSRQLALESGDVIETDAELAVRLALMAVDAAPTEAAGAALRQATAAFSQVRTLDADPIDALTAAYSPDGTRVVTGGAEGRAVVWDTQTRRELASWQPTHGPVTAARYAPDGDSIALAFDDGTVEVTDPLLREPLRRLNLTGLTINSLAFSGDGERLAAAADDGSIHVVETDSSRVVGLLSEHTDVVHGVDFSRDGTRVVSTSADGAVILWDLGGGHRILHRGSQSWDAAFSPNGRLVLAVGDDGLIRRFDGRTGEPRGTTDTERTLYTVAFSRDGTRFATGGEDGVARVWMTAGGPEVAVLRGQRTRVYDIGFGPEPENVVAAGGDGVVRLWEAEATLTLEAPGGPSLVDLSPDGRTLMTSSDDGAVRLWDATDGEQTADLPGVEGPVVGEFAPKSGRVLVAGAGPTVRVWDGTQDETIVELDADRLYVAAANFDMPEERIVYVDADGRIIVRELASGREVTLNGGPQAVYDAQFSGDGARVAIHPEDGILRVWRIDRPDRPERVLRGHRGNINGLAYGRDGRIATAGADGTARIWPAQGSRPLVLSGHAQEVTGVAWSGDQAAVMTTSLDGTLRVWNSRTGEQMARLVTSDAPLWHLAVSPDGKIAYLDENGVVRIIRCGVCGDLDEVAALARSRRPRELNAEERARYAVD